MNSIKANASFIIPRLGLMVVLLWVLWFFTNVVQTTWVVLCKQVSTSAPYTNNSLKRPSDCAAAACIVTVACVPGCTRYQACHPRRFAIPHNGYKVCAVRAPVLAAGPH